MSGKPIAYEVIEAVSSVDGDEWQVEGIDYDNDGIIYLAMFIGHEAKERAEEYAKFKKNRGRLLTLDEVADHLRARLGSVRYWIRMGLLPAILLPAGRTLVEQAALDHFIESRRSPANEQQP